MRFGRKANWGMTAALTLAIYAAVCWAGAGRLVMPPRKPLLERHRSLVAEVAQAGVSIRAGTTREGIPFLLCEPLRGREPGARGKVLRSQLLDRGVAVRAHGEIAGTVVLLHGWGMRKEDLLRTAERFCAAGLRCVIPDLPGHGENPARTTGFGFAGREAAVAAAVLDDAAERHGFPARPAALWGMSMGGAYAIAAAAAEPERWSALVVVSSFDTLGAVVRGQAAGILGGWAAVFDPGFVLAARCRGGIWLPDAAPIRLLSRVRVPVMIVHGDADPLIPIRAGRSLYDAAASPDKRWIRVAGAAHGNVLGTPQQVFVEMAAWMLPRGSADSTSRQDSAQRFLFTSVNDPIIYTCR